MKKSSVLKKIIVSCLFFVLFFGGGTGIFTLSLLFASDKSSYVQLFADEEESDTESEKSSEGVFEKSIFESGGTVIFDKDDDGILNAPPDFGDGGTYPPGGQVNPTLPLSDAYPVLLLLVFFYGCFRLITFLKKREVR